MPNLYFIEIYFEPLKRQKKKEDLAINSRDSYISIYDNIYSMLDTMIECYKKEVYYIENGLLNIKIDQEWEISKKHESEIRFLEITFKRKILKITAAFLFFTSIGCYSCSQPVNKSSVIYEKSFADGNTIDGFEFSKKEIGEIRVSSGKIIACDPFITGAGIPFTSVFPKGSFQVELAIAKKNGDERIAFARILFSENKVTKWKQALIEGQDTSMISGETFGYGVDSGIGSFMDLFAYSKMDSISRIDSTIYQNLMNEWNKNYRDTRGWCIYTIDEENLATFSSGFGDDLYQTFIGYDSNGNICCLLTDFKLINIRD